MPGAPTLRQRLDRCALTAALSTADLAAWMDLPYATVRSYRRGVEPYAARRPQIEERLKWLEQASKKHPYFPVPLNVWAASRKTYIRLVLRDFVLKRVLRSHPP